MQVAVVYVPFLQAAFGTVPLTAMDWLVCLAVSSLVLWPIEILKWAARRRGDSGRARRAREAPPASGGRVG